MCPSWCFPVYPPCNFLSCVRDCPSLLDAFACRLYVALLHTCAHGAYCCSCLLLLFFFLVSLPDATCWCRACCVSLVVLVSLFLFVPFGWPDWQLLHSASACAYVSAWLPLSCCYHTELHMSRHDSCCPDACASLPDSFFCCKFWLFFGSVSSIFAFRCLHVSASVHPDSVHL